MQAASDAVATSLFWGRRIKEQASLGDCQGRANLVIDFEDPRDAIRHLHLFLTLAKINKGVPGSNSEIGKKAFDVFLVTK